jgi:hypothetical protein
MAIDRLERDHSAQVVRGKEGGRCECLFELVSHDHQNLRILRLEQLLAELSGEALLDEELQHHSVPTPRAPCYHPGSYVSPPPSLTPSLLIRLTWYGSE